jgi:predicted AAA+ superfamily ATPase
MKVFQKINRKIYFDELKDCLNTPVIKILKGIRGCGKTSILVEFYEYVKQTYPESNSIFLSFEEYPYSLITSHKELFDLIISKLKPNCQNYLFLDEVQSINHFEEVILHF